MKFLVKNARTAELLKEWSDRNLVVSYFFWKRGSPMQRNRKGLLSSLAHQIIEKQPAILLSLTDINCWNKMYIDDWPEEELEQLLFQCLKRSTQPVCLFLDGLDEIDEHEGPFDLIELIRKIRDQANTKACLASRPDREYFDEYSKLPMMKLQDLTESDIYHYAATELRKYCVNSELDYNTETEKIVKLIVSRANGVFLWVYLVLRSLRKGIQSRGDDWARLTQRVKTTPSELNKLYQDMWERLGDEVALYRRGEEGLQGSHGEQRSSWRETTYEMLPPTAPQPPYNSSPNPFTPISERVYSVSYSPTAVTYAPAAVSYTTAPAFPPSSTSSGYLNDDRYHPFPV
jgi:hypothetical protein